MAGGDEIIVSTTKCRFRETVPLYHREKQLSKLPWKSDHLVKLDKFFSGHLQLPDSERRGREVEEAVFSRDRGETSLQRAGKSPKSHILLHTICNSNSFVLMGLFVIDQLVGRLLQ